MPIQNPSIGEKREFARLYLRLLNHPACPWQMQDELNNLLSAASQYFDPYSTPEGVAMYIDGFRNPQFKMDREV